MRHRLMLATLLVGALRAGNASAKPVAPEMLHVRGAEIVDGKGRAVVLRGVACPGLEIGDQDELDASGRPTAASTLLIDRGSRSLGARRDIDGRLRDSRPDIGAFEYRGGKGR